jgi:hypothetical protein
MQGIPRIERAAAWLFALALVTAAASPALAQHAGKKDKAAHTDEAAEVGGLTAGVDPATGKLRPLTAEEERALLEGISRYVDQSSAGLVERHYSDGSASIDLDERFQSVVMARAGADGKAATRCVTSLAEAKAFLAPPAGDAAPAKAVKGKKAAKAKAKTVAAPAALEER